MEKKDVHKAVRERYGTIAEKGRSCCSPAGTSKDTGSQQIESTAIGYTGGQLGAIPEGADLGLGCGNPTALAYPKEGEVVLDPGSGAGIDCFPGCKYGRKERRTTPKPVLIRHLERIISDSIVAFCKFDFTVFGGYTDTVLKSSSVKREK